MPCKHLGSNLQVRGYVRDGGRVVGFRVYQGFHLSRVVPRGAVPSKLAVRRCAFDFYGIHLSRKIRQRIVVCLFAHTLPVASLVTSCVPRRPNYYAQIHSLYLRSDAHYGFVVPNQYSVHSSNLATYCSQLKINITVMSPRPLSTR